MNFDFSDIRFVDSHGKTLLNYGWDIKSDGVQHKTDGTRARAVVRIPEIPAQSEKIIYMYYGNPSAAPAADLEKTLTWFDHFDTNRRNEYEFETYHEPEKDIVFDTANSLVRFDFMQWAGRPPFVSFSPESFLVKDFIFKARIMSAGGYDMPGYLDTDYRVLDEDNFYRLRISSGDAFGGPPTWVKKVEGAKTIKQRETAQGEVQHLVRDTEIKENIWTNLQINIYETEQKIFWSGFSWLESVYENQEWKYVHHDRDVSWQDIDHDLNGPGKIISNGARSGDQRSATPLIDYIYIRKNTDIKPVTYFK